MGDFLVGFCPVLYILIWYSHPLYDSPSPSSQADQYSYHILVILDSRYLCSTLLRTGTSDWRRLFQCVLFYRHHHCDDWIRWSGSLYYRWQDCHYALCDILCSTISLYDEYIISVSFWPDTHPRREDRTRDAWCRIWYQCYTRRWLISKNKKIKNVYS